MAEDDVLYPAYVEHRAVHAAGRAARVKVQAEGRMELMSTRRAVGCHSFPRRVGHVFLGRVVCVTAIVCGGD
jgi:hypothetical protein